MGQIRTIYFIEKGEIGRCVLNNFEYTNQKYKFSIHLLKVQVIRVSLGLDKG